ncbi:MAG: PAS-domain containing protein, partial [Paracoccaceae bacterium]
EPHRTDESRPETETEPETDAAAHSDLLCEILDRSPMLIWRCAVGGRIPWGNRAYRDLAERAFPDIPPSDGHLPVLFEKPEHAALGSRRMLSLPGIQGVQWFEQFSYPLDCGETIFFSLHADPVVKAEEALRNFVQTLTKTFAHLPTGLAIFDRDRHLALFNPALSDLTTLEPDWLTARPTLHAFLDRLREKRHIPEPRDYKAWRDRIEILDKAAQDGTFEEHWPLPSGQTYRVTGRPHPEGAVAFLFEDITSSVSLERQFRSDLELDQSVIDALDDGLAVFNVEGDLVLSNDALARQWGCDPRELLTRLGAHEALEMWIGKSRPCVAWTRFGEFLALGGEREGGGGAVRLKNGTRLHFTFQALARGAVLCRFSNAIPAAAPRKRKSRAMT